jgi:hypothetical protein
MSKTFAQKKTLHQCVGLIDHILLHIPVKLTWYHYYRYQSDVRTEQRTPYKQYCTVKRKFLIIIAISFIVSPIIIATPVILFLVRSTSISPSKI